MPSAVSRFPFHDELTARESSMGGLHNAPVRDDDIPGVWLSLLWLRPRVLSSLPSLPIAQRQEVRAGVYSISIRRKNVKSLRTSLCRARRSAADHRQRIPGVQFLPGFACSNSSPDSGRLDSSL